MDTNKVDVEYDYNPKNELGKSEDQMELGGVQGLWRPFAGSSSFSNDQANKSSNVVVYRCNNDRSAIFLTHKLQGLCKSPFVKPSFLHQSSTSCLLVGRKFEGEGSSVKDWCQKHYKSFWCFYPLGGKSAVSLGEDARKLFCQVLNGMNSYHERDISHGNLKHGIMIINENQVLFYNEQFTEKGRVEGILSDIADFHSILVEAVETVSDQYAKNGVIVQSPPSYHALAELFGDLHWYQQDIRGVRKFEFLIRNNPFFLDITGYYLMLHKIYDYRLSNVNTFDYYVRLDTGATCLGDWYSTIGNKVLMPKVYREEFQRPTGVALFIKDIYGHSKQEVSKQERRVIDNGIITQVLRDELPKLLPFWFLELVREMDQDPKDSYLKDLFNGYSPYEFLKMDPGFT